MTQRPWAYKRVGKSGQKIWFIDLVGDSKTNKIAVESTKPSRKSSTTKQSKSGKQIIKSISHQCHNYHFQDNNTFKSKERPTNNNINRNLKSALATTHVDQIPILKQRCKSTNGNYPTHHFQYYTSPQTQRTIHNSTYKKKSNHNNKQVIQLQALITEQSNLIKFTQTDDYYSESNQQNLLDGVYTSVPLKFTPKQAAIIIQRAWRAKLTAKVIQKYYNIAPKLQKPHIMFRKKSQPKIDLVQVENIDCFNKFIYNNRNKNNTQFSDTIIKQLDTANRYLIGQQIQNGKKYHIEQQLDTINIRQQSEIINRYPKSYKTSKNKESYSRSPNMIKPSQSLYESEMNGRLNEALLLLRNKQNTSVNNMLQQLLHKALQHKQKLQLQLKTIGGEKEQHTPIGTKLSFTQKHQNGNDNDNSISNNYKGNQNDNKDEQMKQNCQNKKLQQYEQFYINECSSDEIIISNSKQSDTFYIKTQKDDLIISLNNQQKYQSKQNITLIESSPSSQQDSFTAYINSKQSLSFEFDHTDCLSVSMSSPAKTIQNDYDDGSTTMHETIFDEVIDEIFKILPDELIQTYLMHLHTTQSPASITYRLNLPISPTSIQMLKFIRNPDFQLPDYELALQQTTFRQWRTKMQQQWGTKSKTNEIAYWTAQTYPNAPIIPTHLKQHNLFLNERHNNNKQQFANHSIFHRDLTTIFLKAVFNALNQCIIDIKTTQAFMCSRNYVGRGDLSQSLKQFKHNYNEESAMQTIYKAENKLMQIIQNRIPLCNQYTLREYQRTVLWQSRQQLIEQEHKWVNYMDQVLDTWVDLTEMLYETLLNQFCLEIKTL